MQDYVASHVINMNISYEYSQCTTHEHEYACHSFISVIYCLVRLFTVFTECCCVFFCSPRQVIILFWHSIWLLVSQVKSLFICKLLFLFFGSDNFVAGPSKRIDKEAIIFPFCQQTEWTSSNGFRYSFFCRHYCSKSWGGKNGLDCHVCALAKDIYTMIEHNCWLDTKL